MLALGVLIMSRGLRLLRRLAQLLFSAALGITPAAIVVQALAAVTALVGVVVSHRAFLALSFERTQGTIAQTAPCHRASRPADDHRAVDHSSFRAAVGNLLVYGLLIAPPATIGVVSVSVGLLASYHLGPAAGAAIAAIAVAGFFVTLTATQVRVTWHRRSGSTATDALP